MCSSNRMRLENIPHYSIGHFSGLRSGSRMNLRNLEIMNLDHQQNNPIRHCYRLILLLALAAFFVPRLDAAAQHAPQEAVISDRAATDITEVRLISDVDAVAPGAHFWLALHLDTKDDWHSYWENPGDSGVPTTLEWQAPSGFEIGKTAFLPPSRIETNGIFNFGFDRETYLLIPVTAPEKLENSGPYRFTVTANWLVCKDICVPENATLALSLDAAVGSDRPMRSPHAALIDAQRQKLPKMIEPHFSYYTGSKQVTLSLPLEALDTPKIRNVTFFPRQNGIVQNGGGATIAENNGVLEIRLPQGDRAPIDRLSGVLAVQGAAKSPLRYFDLTFAHTRTAPSVSPAHREEQVENSTGGSVWHALMLAILGGLILNIMPCVLPVLSLKALSVAKKSAHHSRAIRLQGLAYTAGILLCFLVLAGILLIAQQGGEAIGWGYQMQSPLFVGAMIYLMLLVGLNLSGVYELPVLFGSTGSDITRRDDWVGSFFTGLLAALVATPCSAPFMAPAVGFALTLPPLQSLSVFMGLGFGLALPYLAICFFPPLLRLLPKPGAWMHRFKEFLAFPMYATAVWLIWVLAQQSGADGVALVLAGGVVIAFSLWIWPVFAGRAAWVRVPVFVILALLAGIPLLRLMPPPMGTPQGTPMAMAHEAYTPERLEALRKEGKTVLVDATAAWCITCKINERLVLNTDAVTALFSQHEVTVLVADWTNRDDRITAFLAEFKRRGVPLYALYRPGQEPLLLPQVLSFDILRDALEQP